MSGCRIHTMYRKLAELKGKRHRIEREIQHLEEHIGRVERSKLENGKKPRSHER